MAMSAAAHHGPSAEMNVTPLIDVLLVLLIIFMVITPSTLGLKALVPQAPGDPHPPADDQAVVLQVLDAGGGRTALKLNAEAVSWESVQARLHDVFLPRVDKVLFLKGDQNVNFEDVARAIDLARTAGVDRVGLVTAKIGAGE